LEEVEWILLDCSDLEGVESFCIHRMQQWDLLVRFRQYSLNTLTDVEECNVIIDFLWDEVRRRNSFRVNVHEVLIVFAFPHPWCQLGSMLGLLQSTSLSALPLFELGEFL
jgi:hypothetical protein